MDDSTGEVTGNFFVDQAHIPILDASHIDTDSIHSLGNITGPLVAGNVTINPAGGSSANINVGSGTAIDDGNITTGTLTANSGITTNEISINSNMELSGHTITSYGTGPNGADEHVVWTSGDHRNLGAYINAHIKSSAIIGGQI